MELGHHNRFSIHSNCKLINHTHILIIHLLGCKLTILTQAAHAEEDQKCCLGPWGWQVHGMVVCALA